MTTAVKVVSVVGEKRKIVTFLSVLKAIRTGTRLRFQIVKV